MFLQRSENTATANNAAINSTKWKQGETQIRNTYSYCWWFQWKITWTSEKTQGVAPLVISGQEQN